MSLRSSIHATLWTIRTPEFLMTSEETCAGNCATKTVDGLCPVARRGRNQPRQEAALRPVVGTARQGVSPYRPPKGREARYLPLACLHETLLQRVPEHERLGVSQPVGICEDIPHPLD